MSYPENGTGELKIWYSNGQLKIDANIINYKYIGEFKEWWKNGKLKTQSFVIDGTSKERHLHWWKNGNLKTDIIFKDDKYNGEYKKYFKNGKLKLHTNYINGKEEGIHTEWYNNGNKKREYFCDKGRIKCISECIEWYPKLYKGQPQIMAITKYINENYDGEYKEWYSIKEGGHLKLCYSNGQLKIESQSVINDKKWSNI